MGVVIYTGGVLLLMQDTPPQEVTPFNVRIHDATVNGTINFIGRALSKLLESTTLFVLSFSVPSKE